MLSEQVTQLLTAFVDGELTPRERAEVVRLLEKSSEAREMLRQLQENAHKIKQLPRRKVEPSLVDEIMQAIAEQKAQRAAPVRRARRRWLPFLTAAMAASLMLCVLSVLAWRTFRTDEPVNNPIVQNSPDKKSDPVTPPPVTPPTVWRPNPLLGPLVEGTVENFAKAPVPETGFSARFAELHPDKGAKSADLAMELQKDPTVQLDITVKNNAMAMARLKDVLKDRGITLVTDQSAAKSLTNKSQAKVEYLVYADSLTRDELTKLMGDLGQSYVVGANNNQRTEQSPYQKVTVAPIAKTEIQRVAKLLGVDPATLEMKGKEPKADAKRQVILLPTASGGQPSAEVRQFVNQRRPQPGAVPVLIKIRQE
ncbi:MAG TPA: zf-HC2 domain-containing protein [Gemmataceae bacterium]|nr:zf-HC2 domain-containing protein [Gemmataceae bacterium]